MKKFNIIKTVQLVLTLVFTALCAYRIFFRMDLYHAIAQDPVMQVLCWMLWASIGLSFIFIFLDFGFFADYKREYRELDYAVHSDPMSGLANRNSCDAIIDRYADKPLPDGVGCVMLELTNINTINKKFNHAEGNALIRDFSNILKMASVSLCFVGRNGGNKFLAIFEESTREQIETFLERIDQKVAGYNGEHPDKPIAYSFGIAFNEDVNLTITELVALSNRRIVR